MKSLGQTIVSTFLIAAASVGCSEPDKSELGIPCATFEQEVHTAYSAEDGLPDDDVLAIASLKDGSLYAGTTTGLVRFADGQWEAVPDYERMNVDLLAAGHGESQFDLFVASGGTVHGLKGSTGNDIVDLSDNNGNPTKIHAIADEGTALWVGTDAGLLRVEGGVSSIVTELDVLLGDGKKILDIAVGNDSRIAVAAVSGLFLRDGTGKWGPLFPQQGDRSWAPRDVRAVAFDAEGRLWFASPQGVGCLDGEEWQLFAGSDGLPYNDFTTIAPGGDDAIWFGTHHGAIRFDGEDWNYREGKRWLPDNDVRDIAVAPGGNAWFATAKGVGLIERRPMTFAEKAEFFEDEIDKRHRRTPYEYVRGVSLARPGDKSEWTQHDDDNDGQYTGMYGAAECFAYAATGDPKAKRRAKKAFEALRFFSQVTQGGSHPAPRGFPARTILPTSGWNPNESVYTLESDRERQKEDLLWKIMHPRWPTSEDGKWYWKCDTSSDELDGHYYLYGIYYDLVAETEDEKDRVREVVRDITDHLIENDYRLRDWDGKPTRWANFRPASLNRDPDWWGERGLNSLSVLSYLRVAEHVTGDKKYGEAVLDLVENHGYAMNALVPKIQRGPGSYVQFDDEMAFMNYYNLLRYEEDPKLREIFASSCFRYWELLESELCPFFNFTYAALCQGAEFHTPWGTEDLSPKKKCIEEGIETLERYPLDLVDWKMTNSHRIDLLPLPEYVRELGEAKGKGYRVSGKVLPVDERFLNHWADDPWTINTGGEGKGLATGYPFLLAYYMGLYHGFIVEE